jgi:hypothetical protein
MCHTRSSTVCYHYSRFSDCSLNPACCLPPAKIQISCLETCTRHSPIHNRQWLKLKLEVDLDEDEEVTEDDEVPDEAQRRMRRRSGMSQDEREIGKSKESGTNSLGFPSPSSVDLSRTARSSPWRRSTFSRYLSESTRSSTSSSPLSRTRS